MQLRGTTVLITGASYGIGAALARSVAQRGATCVVLMARSADALGRVAETVTAMGARALPLTVDLTDDAALASAVRTLLAETGVPDVVISNAGSGRWLAIDETEPAEARAMMAMPYFAAFTLTRLLIGPLLARGAGHLVYVNSPAALMPWPGACAYSAARWALRGFAEALRADLHGTPIMVSTVVLGMVESQYFAHNPGVAERIPRLARRVLPPLSTDQAAAAILDGIERRQRLIIAPAALRGLFWLHAVAPWLVRRLTLAGGWRRGVSGEP
jgi:short-subunit dehydrogenase